MIDAKVVEKAVDTLSMLKYFPANGTPVARLIGDICSTNEQVLWLARRVTQLYNEWPGPVELRAVFCSRFRPRDGVEADSTDPRFIEEGIPSERKPDGELPALPAGRKVSADRLLDEGLASLAARKRLM
jgi:hypothetical protein